MKKNFKWLMLSGVLVFYAFLYIATSVDKGDVEPYDCDEVCEKIRRVDSLIRIDHAQTFTGKCHTGEVCILVNDSPASNRKGLADAACMYLSNEGLLNYTVSVIDYSSQDTLLKQTCP